jgi:hypothetical protein
VRHDEPAAVEAAVADERVEERRDLFDDLGRLLLELRSRFAGRRGAIRRGVGVPLDFAPRC